jgi:eukaryotic-like serine/threonine-protein kinase
MADRFQRTLLQCVPSSSLARRWFAGHRVGPYQVVRTLEPSLFATAVLARRAGSEPTGFAKLVALHVTDGCDVQGLSLDERRLRALRHEHIVDLYDLRHVDGDLVVETEHVEGVTLQSFLERVQHRVSLQVAGHIATSLLQSVSWLHGAKDSQRKGLGLRHGQLVPACVLLSHTGAVKLSLPASVYCAQLPRSRDVPRYMAPEQCAGSEATDSADVHAIGVMLYEMLAAGQHPRWPREEANDYDAMLAIASSALVPIRERVPVLSAELAELIDSMLAHDPLARPSAAEALRCLVRALPFEPMHIERMMGRKVRRLLRGRSAQPEGVADAPTEHMVLANEEAPSHAPTVPCAAVPEPTIIVHRSPLRRWVALTLVGFCVAAVLLLVSHV